jgi:hypothetical protein
MKIATLITFLLLHRKVSGSHQRQAFPEIIAMALFQPYTATGKLNAVMIPTKPTGFHCSMSAWPGPKNRGRHGTYSMPGKLMRTTSEIFYFQEKSTCARPEGIPDV